jgi:hypothetical protein
VSTPTFKQCNGKKPGSLYWLPKLTSADNSATPLYRCPRDLFRETGLRMKLQQTRCPQVTGRPELYTVLLRTEVNCKEGCTIVICEWNTVIRREMSVKRPIRSAVDRPIANQIVLNRHSVGLQGLTRKVLRNMYY